MTTCLVILVVGLTVALAFLVHILKGILKGSDRMFADLRAQADEARQEACAARHQSDQLRQELEATQEALNESKSRFGKVVYQYK